MSSINFRGQNIVFTSRDNFFRIVEAGQWEKETFDVLDHFIVPGKIFVDIGAWVGVLSLYAALKGARVYAVEPDEVAFHELFSNVEANQLLKQISMQMVAVSDHCGNANLNTMTSDGFGNSESSLLDRGVIKNSRQVRTYRLQEYLAEFVYLGVHNIQDICLIKIDIEGSELLLLEGAKDFLKEHAPKIYISFHPAWFPNKEKDVERIIDIIFPVYNVISAQASREYSIDDFKNAMSTGHDHSFILTKKNNL